MEEQLDSFVELLANATSKEVIRHQSKPIRNLIANRSKKYRRRDQLLRDSYQHICRKSFDCNTFELLSYGESIDNIRFQLSESELRVFENLATGDDYVTIADRHLMTPSALKSKIARCRERIRKSSSYN